MCDAWWPPLLVLEDSVTLAREISLDEVVVIAQISSAHQCFTLVSPTQNPPAAQAQS